MDIQILLWLQELRLAWGPGVEAFFVRLTNFAASSYVIIIPCLIYWCFKKSAGQEILGLTAFGPFVNQLVKNTACVYRPWIREPALHVSEGAAPGATGYSFPSGHVTVAAGSYGGLGWIYRSKPVFSACCAIFVALVAFSRMFLGCHTPQDVAVALLLSVLVITGYEKGAAWIARHEEMDTALLIAGLAVSVLALLYWTLKPYPMDYVDGKLLVDPVLMQVDCYKAAGVLMAFTLGCFIEHRYIGFTTEGIDAGERVRRGVTGTILLLVSNKGSKLLCAGMEIRMRGLITHFVPILVVMTLVPALFGLWQKKRIDVKK